MNILRHTPAPAAGPQHSATGRSRRRSFLRITGALGAAAITLTLAPMAEAGEGGGPAAPPQRDQAPGQQLKADSTGSAADFRAEKEIREEAAELAKQLKGATGGSYLTDKGTLVVTVTTEDGARIVRAEGAVAEWVDDTQAELDRLMARLNQRADQLGAGTVQGWRVDVVTNSIVVTATQGADDAKSEAFLRWAKQLDDVVVEQEPAAVAPTTTDSLYGGLQYVPGAGTCSVGFNAVDASNRHVFLTAGHCVTSYPTASRNGYWIGNTRSMNFPADDFAVVNNNYPTYWTPKPWVSQYNGYAKIVRGSWGNPPIGATVCKSGRTTGWTCGVIRSMNQTVNYSNGPVYGLVRHNACVEPGDSGGSNISSGGYALGLTSGASFYSTGTYANKCLSKVPGAGESISYYQPIGEALTRNGLRLLVQP